MTRRESCAWAAFVVIFSTRSRTNRVLMHRSDVCLHPSEQRQQALQHVWEDIKVCHTGIRNRCEMRHLSRLKKWEGRMRTCMLYAWLEQSNLKPESWLCDSTGFL